MKILVIGASGLVGSRFTELYPTPGDLITPTSHELDLTHAPQLREYLARTQPDAVINLAAYTDVAGAESQRGDKSGLCWQLNVVGPTNLASAITPTTRLLQISTDMVFSGLPDNPGPYPESHPPEKDSSRLTWYGFTKAESERALRRSLGNRATILRLIYPVRANFPAKLDYLRKPLKLFDEGKLYPMFTDQQISISFIDEAATALKKILFTDSTGIFHASSPDTTTPFELCSYLILKARGTENAVHGGDLDSFLKTASNPTRYPKFGGLKVEETEQRLGIKFSRWKQIVDKLLEQGIARATTNRK